MLVADMALAKARVDRSAELQTENENRYIDRTVDYWEQDQHERALKLWKRIGQDPETDRLQAFGLQAGRGAHDLRLGGTGCGRAGDGRLG